MLCRRVEAIAGVTVVLLAGLVPSLAGAQPNGNGLYQHNAESCTNGATPSMLLSGGSSIWIDGHHYLVQSYTADGVSGRTHGNMTGPASRGTIECKGMLNGTAIVSRDVLVK